MPVTQAQKDSMLALVGNLDTQINALVVDAGPPPPPVNPTVTLSANPVSVVAGSPSTLTWGSTDAVGGVAIDQGVGAVAVSGSQPVTPAATTTYTATATGAQSTTPATAQAIVTVTAAQTGGPLSTLAPGMLRDLGPFANPDPALGQAINSTIAIGDDSGFIYDKYRQLLRMFGGGHGPCNETDIRNFALLICNGWTSEYQSKTHASMLFADWDIPFGRWITSTPQGQHPCARHTYNMMVVTPTAFIIMQWYAMPYHPYGSPDSSRIQYNTNPSGGRISKYTFATGQWSYSNIQTSAYPYDWSGAPCVYDDTSGKVIIAGGQRNGTNLGIWTYDDPTDVLTQIRAPGTGGFNCGATSDLVSVPSRDRLYNVQGRTGDVFEIALNRTTWTATVVTKLAKVGAPQQLFAINQCPNAFAHDPANDIIGGYINNGIFNYFDVPAPGDPVVWKTKQMVRETGGNSREDQKMHCLDFSTADECFMFNTVNPGEGSSASGGLGIYSHTHSYRFG